MYETFITQILGQTNGTPQTVSSGATASASPQLSGFGPERAAIVALAVSIPGSAPSAAPTVAFGFSLDGGVTFFYDSYPTMSTAAQHVTYEPPMLATHVVVNVKNNDAGSNAIGIFAQVASVCYG